MNKPIKIVQISDSHLYGDPSKELLGVNTLESLQAVLDLIRFQKDIDLIILSGDLSQDGSDASYRKLDELLSQFPIPTYYFPGNHDELAAMLRVFPNHHIQNDRHIVLNDWQIILLDSQIPGAVEGCLQPNEFEFMNQCLAAEPKKHAIVMMHHHPVPIGSLWLDQIGLKNASEFWQQLKPHRQVKAVIYGHVHQENHQVMQGIPCYAAPSTCVQFMRQSEKFGLENLPPGYRVTELQKNGSIKTKVERAAEYIGHFDPDAKGY